MLTYPCSGIGGSLVYSPSLVVLCEYFDKKRSLAFGMATAGTSIGAIVVPHIMVLLFQHYGFFGGLFILGAAMYNCCVSGAFYRPVTPHIPYQPTQTLAVLSFSLVFMLTPALAEDVGMSEEQAATVLSTTAAADLVGHVVSAFLFDIHCVRRQRYQPFSACMLIVALTIFWLPFMTSFEVMLLCTVVFGFSVGIVIAHRNNILCDLLGTDRISTAVGMMAFDSGYVSALLRQVGATHIPIALVCPDVQTCSSLDGIRNRSTNLFFVFSIFF